jgi:FAD synthase
MFGKKKDNVAGDRQIEDKKCLSIVYNRFYLQMNKLNQYMGAHVANDNMFEGKIAEIDLKDNTTCFPTAKIEVETVKNRSGSYVATAKIGEEYFKCIAFIDSKNKAVELYFVDGIKGDLVGQNVEVNLIRFIRERQNYNSKKALAEAISSDLYVAKTYFKENDILDEIKKRGGGGNFCQNNIQNTLF